MRRGGGIAAIAGQHRWPAALGRGRPAQCAMTGHVLYLVGGPPRVGKSVLAERLLRADGIPWLPTDVIRTVLRRVLPDLDAADQDPVDAARLAEVMYPHIEQAAGVGAEDAEQFLIEGFGLSPSHPARLQAALAGITVRHASWATPLLRKRPSLLPRAPSPSTKGSYRLR
jgi:hypothetical protein